MAKVSAHGAEIGTVEFTTSAKRYMSDGAILVNRGLGWKIGGKVKAGVEPAAAFERQRARLKAYLDERPALRRYRELLHDLASLSKRWKLHAAIQMMPDDADGVWSEACDGYGDNVSASVDDVVALCRAHKVAVLENEEIKKEDAEKERDRAVGL